MKEHDLWHEDFYDLIEVLEFGAKKHGPHNWLIPNGSKATHKAMCDSMFHHLAEAYVGQQEDHETGLNPLLHLACRALMLYVRQKNGIIEEKPNE